MQRSDRGTHVHVDDAASSGAAVDAALKRPRATGPSARWREPDADAQLDELRFLHEVARLATTVSTWDELLEIVVDRTRDALHADISSLYLLDRDEEALTLAATNGLDKFQIGRARVPFGEGITGLVAAQRTPLVIPDVKTDDRFLWVRGLDQRRFVTSMLSVPLSWNDQVVGVLNVQTERARTFTRHDVAQLSAVADLLAGIVAKGRLQRDAEEQVQALKALEEARTDLIALVTHELRTPLAVVRAYLDLLADAVPTDAPTRASASEWYLAASDQVMRLDRLVDSILASVRPETQAPIELEPVDIDSVVDQIVEALAPLLRRHHLECIGRCQMQVLADASRLRQILEHLLENAVKYAPPNSTITIGVGLFEGVAHIDVADQGPGVPEEWRERIFEPYARHDTRTARGSGIGLYAARRLARSMGASLWCEPASGGGARFVLALPAAVAV